MTPADIIALAWFCAHWLGFAWVSDHTATGRSGLTAQMNEYRSRWMLTMTSRDLRIVDTSIMAGLQNGTAFFASTALIAIGAGLTLLSAADEALGLFAELPFGRAMTRLQWEAKVGSLTLIFVYAFFKFAWAYRLFNYASIVVGATPMPGRGLPGEAEDMARRAARMNILAGSHFNRGVRALFFASALLGWFISPYLFMAATSFVLAVIYRRQFHSEPLAALRDPLP